MTDIIKVIYSLIPALYSRIIRLNETKLNLEDFFFSPKWIRGTKKKVNDKRQTKKKKNDKTAFPLLCRFTSNTSDFLPLVRKHTTHLSILSILVRKELWRLPILRTELRQSCSDTSRQRKRLNKSVFLSSMVLQKNSPPTLTP